MRGFGFPARYYRGISRLDSLVGADAICVDFIRKFLPGFVEKKNQYPLPFSGPWVAGVANDCCIRIYTVFQHHFKPV